MAITITKNGVGSPLYAAGGNILTGKSPTLDQTYGPWPSLEDAFSCLTQIYGDATEIPVGVTVGIISAQLTGRPKKWVIEDGAEIKEYQLKGKRPEAGYTVNDFKLKNAAVVEEETSTTTLPPFEGKTIEDAIKYYASKNSGVKDSTLFGTMNKLFYANGVRTFASQYAYLAQAVSELEDGASSASVSPINFINANDVVEFADKIKIGQVYAPLASDTNFGASYNFIELENSYSNLDFPLYGCQIIIYNGEQLQKIDITDKSAILRHGSTFLIRCGEQHPITDKTFIKVDSYDVDAANIDLTVHENKELTIVLLYNPIESGVHYYGDEQFDKDNIFASIMSANSSDVALTLLNGTAPSTETKWKVSDHKVSGKTDVMPMQYKLGLYIDGVSMYNVASNTLVAPSSWISTFPTKKHAYSNTIAKNVFELDPAKQAFQGASGKDSSRIRNTKLVSTNGNVKAPGNDDYYIHLDKQFIEFPNSIETYDVAKFTPKASYEGKNVCTDKTSFDIEKPQMVTTSFGVNIYTTRCFNWVSAGSNDEYLWIRKKGAAKWSNKFESYKAGDGVETKSTKTGIYRKEFSPLVNDNVYARLSGTFPGCGIAYTAHKLVLNIVDKPVNNKTEYEYVVGRKDASGYPDAAHCSDVYSFTLYPETYTPKVYQTTDQQGFHWVEYQVWAAVASKLNETIEADCDAENIIPILLNTGDMTQNGTRINEWLDYYNAGSCLFDHIEQMNVVGNNDLCDIDIAKLGTGNDEGKSNPYFFHVFYCYEINEDIFIPVLKATKENSYKYIPSIYYFDYKVPTSGEPIEYRMVMLNSELTTTYCNKWLKLLTDTTNVIVNAYTGWTIDTKGSTSFVSSHVTSENNGGNGWIYDMIYNIFNDAAGKEVIAVCHEMPFTVITQESTLSDSTKKYYQLGRSLSNAKKLVGSHMNQMDPNDKGALYWFSRLLEHFGVKLCIGGHKHTYTCTFPVAEYYAYVQDGNYYTSAPASILEENALLNNNAYNAVTVKGSNFKNVASDTVSCTPNGPMTMLPTLAQDNITFVWDDYIGYGAYATNSTYKELVSDVDHSKFPLKYAETWSEEKDYGGTSTTFSVITTINKELPKTVLYFMCQASGYKLTSNKELPSDKQMFSQILPSDDATTASDDQKLPMFVMLNFTEQKEIKLQLARVINILTGVTTQNDAKTAGCQYDKQKNGISFDNYQVKFSGGAYGSFTNDFFNTKSPLLQYLACEGLSADYLTTHSTRRGKWDYNSNNITITIK